jgi:hypothetical protein
MTPTGLGRSKTLQNLSITLKAFYNVLLFAFDTAIRGHVHIVDFCQRGFRGAARL